MTTPPFHDTEPVVADLRPTAAGSDRVCATCGKHVVGSTDPRHGWTHVKAASHEVQVVMGKSQWDKWKR